MKTSILAALGLVAFVSAQGTLPACATSCALTAIGSTGCQATDAACICTKQSFLSGVQSCIQTACSAADIQATLEYAKSFCGSAGVTISVPAASSAPASSAAASSAPASSAAASTTYASSSAKASYAASSAPSGPPVSQISDGQPQAPTSTAAPATFTGAAAPLQKNLIGGLAAVALGAAAAL